MEQIRVSEMSASKMNPSQFPQLQAFLAVARLHSFSKAARELGVSRSATSQAVRQLEEAVRVPLLTRTTRSVALTEAGKRLADEAGPGVGQVLAALAQASTRPGEAVGKLRITAPQIAVSAVVAPVLPTFRARYPRVELDVVVEDRFVDIVAEGYDAGVRLSESIERDMVQVRLTEAFRFVVVGAPEYLERHGRPQKPEDLLEHECLAYRSNSTGSIYAWELERGRRTWRVPIGGDMASNDVHLLRALVEAGAGLAYVPEPWIREQIDAGRLVVVLDAYAASVPGYFLYFPGRSQRSGPLRLFIDVAKELLRKKV